jgi:hypothetical protein
MKEVREVTIKLSARHKARRYQVQYDYATGEPRCVSVWAATGGINSHYIWRAIWNDNYPLDGVAAAVIKETNDQLDPPELPPAA